MKFKLFFCTTCLISFFSGNLLAQGPIAQQDVYKAAGAIKVHDPKAVMVGYRHQGDDIFEISLDDVGKYTGHVCAGVASGFLLTKQALEALYPDGGIPVRGQISIAASSYSDHGEVAAYIVRARQDAGNEGDKNIFLIDKNIPAKPNSVVLIFKREDNGKMAKAIFNKSKMAADPEKIRKMGVLKKKILSGKASEEEKKTFAHKVQKLVKKVIRNTPEGLLEVSSCTDYQFAE